MQRNKQNSECTDTYLTGTNGLGFKSKIERTFVMKLFLLALLIPIMANADSILTVKRTPSAFYIVASASSVISNQPREGHFKSRVLYPIGSSQHMKLCSTANAVIRYNYQNNAEGYSTANGAYLFNASGKSVYDGFISAAPAGAEVCDTLDDVQLGQSLYIWAEGTSITSGEVRGQVW